MTGTYKFLAYAIAVLVVVQAGAIAWAFFGVTDWVTNSNGVIDKAYLECEQTARAERRGLWRDSKPVPPWEWRRNPRTKELEP